MQFKTLVISFIFSVLFFTGCSDKQDNKETPVKSNNNFTLKTIDNKNINIVLEDGKILVQEYANKIVLLNFFATWCPPCKAEIPVLNKIQDKYKNDLVIISVLLENNKSNEQLTAFANDYLINYTITNGVENYNLQNALGGIKSIPTMLMIDKNSKLFQKYVGMVPSEMLDIDIKKVLKK
ncbi:MAG: TlpA disulfide reductase family protein [Sulfurovum sp.]|jgi:thiol-disulfide isomerase/thioredoxin|nr:MAG: Thiol-disulfide oxidoreductase ResA [Arcobacter lacus]